MNETAMTVKLMITFPEKLLWKSIPKMNLVVVDYVSKWAEAQALPTNDGPIGSHLMKKLICYLESKALISDRGTLALRYGKLQSMLKIALLQLCISLCPEKYRSPLIFLILSLLSVITTSTLIVDIPGYDPWLWLDSWDLNTFAYRL
ncbi:reverse transcriptase domain-containing protein [Tanacetum coccineum]